MKKMSPSKRKRSTSSNENVNEEVPVKQICQHDDISCEKDATSCDNNGLALKCTEEEVSALSADGDEEETKGSAEDEEEDAEDDDEGQGVVCVRERMENGILVNGITPMTLREFDVLDQFDRNEDDNCDQDSDISDGSYDSDIPDEEVEAMLEEGLPDEFRGPRKLQKDDCAFVEKEKVVLQELAHNHFDVLPEGWVQVTHNSGMPIFLHRQSRVVTFAKPYFLGPGSARKHEVPLSAIPCLQYQRALEAEEVEKKVEDARIDSLQSVASTSNGYVAGAHVLPNARIETCQENKVSQSLSSVQVREYCQKQFKFKAIKVMRFKSWSERRNFTKSRKQQKQLQRPTMPEGTKLIKFPVQHNDNLGSGSRPNKEWIMNPNGKSYVCILHEYVQHAMKKQPSYQFKELENAATPYAATVTINAMQYGIGYGTSKKQAKSEAAKATLEILIPEMREKIQVDNRVGTRGASKGQDTDLSFFDEIKIEDPRVADLCAKTTEPSPYAILLTCLQRNFGLGEMHIKYEVNTLRHQKNEFTMMVGRHTSKVVCKNKRDGKQRASQAILQVLHPHIVSWGSLLRLYGNRSVKNIKEKKQEEQEITLLQSKASINSPNYAILEKLQAEMTKLNERRAAVVPIGKFIPPDDVDLPTASNADLNNVDL